MKKANQCKAKTTTVVRVALSTAKLVDLPKLDGHWLIHCQHMENQSIKIEVQSSQHMKHVGILPKKRQYPSQIIPQVWSQEKKIFTCMLTYHLVTIATEDKICLASAKVHEIYYDIMRSTT